MNKPLASAVMLCSLLCGVAVADAPSGVFTYVTYNGGPQANATIECWYKTYSMSDWVYHSTHSTTEQNNPPNYNYIRWAHSSQSDPKVVIDTAAVYTFMAKAYAGGQWRYSEWSSSADYAHPITYISVELALTRTTDPGDPPDDGSGSR